MMRNIYKEAIDVQDASNPSGVVIAFNQAVDQIRQEPGYRVQGTPYLSKHPVFIMFISKLADMAHIQFDDGTIFGNAYQACKDQVTNAEANTSSN